MIINIQDDILKIQALRLLDRLLVDKTTKRNIMWATDAHNILETKYERNEEITVDLITGRNAGVIKTRARKAMEQQFNEDLKAEGHNFVEADAAEAAKKGELEELVEEYFGDKGNDSRSML